MNDTPLTRAARIDEPSPWMEEAERAIPAPVWRLDYRAGLGVLAQAGLRRDWYRLDGRGGATELRPAEDDALRVRMALARDPGCEVLGYRPRQRLVLRRRSPIGIVVEMGFRDGGRTLALMRHRTACGALSGSPLRAPRILGSAVERDSIIVQDLGGNRPAIRSRSTELFRTVGVGVRRLQSVKVVGCLPVVGPRDVLDDLDRQAATVLELGLDLPGGYSHCREAVAMLVLGLGELAPVLCHRDLHDRQLLVSGQRVGIVDFSSLCLADPAVDPGNLLAHLELRVLEGVDAASAEALAGLSAAFLSGWGADGAQMQERLRAYLAVGLLRLTLAHTLRPSSRSLVPGLIRRSERWLGDRIARQTTSR